MNKKVWIALILFLPLIFAAIWFLFLSQDKVTPSTVSSVSLETMDGTSTVFTSEADKEFLLGFLDNIVPIEEQIYDESVYSLYKLEFEKSQGNLIYYLCLSADVRNCLAFDSDENWYRIDKEYAKTFIVKHAINTVYRNYEVPVLSFSANGKTAKVNAAEAKWHYLLPDETYKEVLIENEGSFESDVFVVSGETFELSFDLPPDGYWVKVYDGDTLIFDSVIDDVIDFSNCDETRLRAVITAEWYNETQSPYHGKATYDVAFDYDIKASYTADKTEAAPGEVVYVHIKNAENETLELSSSLPSVENLSAHPYLDGKLVILPIPSNTASGNYDLTIKSDKVVLSVPVTVKEKVFSTVDVGFVGHESAEEYNTAHSLFLQEISSAFDISSTDVHWINGLLSPVQKYVGGVEQYWISLPGYGVFQRINGTLIDERSYGIHYVKGVVSESMPMRAVADGTVAFVGTTTLYGNTVVIEHGLGFKSVYGHLGETDLSLGEAVTRGEILGVSSPTGFAVASTEAFFGILVNGVFVNPYNYIVEIHNETESDVSEPVSFIIDLQPKPSTVIDIESIGVIPENVIPEEAVSEEEISEEIIPEEEISQ